MTQVVRLLHSAAETDSGDQSFVESLATPRLYYDAVVTHQCINYLSPSSLHLVVPHAASRELPFPRVLACRCLRASKPCPDILPSSSILGADTRRPPSFSFLKLQYIMPFNTLTVVTAVTPQVIETYVSHVRPPARFDPIQHLTAPVPQPQKPPPEAHSPHILPRGAPPNPPIPLLRLPPHRRGHPGLHIPMGAPPPLGPRRGRDHPRETHIRSQRRPDCPIRPGRRATGRRGALVALAAAEERVEGSMD